MSIITSRTHRRLIWAVAAVLLAVLVAVAALTRGHDSVGPAAQTRASVPTQAHPAREQSRQAHVAKVAPANAHTLDRAHRRDRAHASSQAAHKTFHPRRSSRARSSGQPAPATTTPQSAAGTPAAPAVPRGGRTIRTFAGSGNGLIGSVSEHTTTVLEWRAPGQGIQIFTSRGALLVDSATGIGSVRLPRGEYAGLRVASRGSWVIRLRAQL